MSYKETSLHKLTKKQSNIGRHETFDALDKSHSNALFSSQEVELFPVHVSLRQTNVFCSPIVGQSFRNTKKITRNPHKKVKQHLPEKKFNKKVKFSKKVTPFEQEAHKKTTLSAFSCHQSDHNFQKDQELYYTDLKYSLPDVKLLHNAKLCTPANLAYRSEGSQVADKTTVKNNPEEYSAKRRDAPHENVPSLLTGSHDFPPFFSNSYQPNLPEKYFVPKLLLDKLQDCNPACESNSSSPAIRVRDLEVSDNGNDLYCEPHRLEYGHLCEQYVMSGRSQLQKDLKKQRPSEINADSARKKCKHSPRNCPQFVRTYVTPEALQNSQFDLLHNFEDTPDVKTLRVRDLESESVTSLHHDDRNNHCYGADFDNLKFEDKGLHDNAHQTNSTIDSSHNFLYHSAPLKTDNKSDNALSSDFPKVSSTVFSTENCFCKDSPKNLPVRKSVQFDLESCEDQGCVNGSVNRKKPILEENAFLQNEIENTHAHNVQKQNVWNGISLSDLYGNDFEYKKEKKDDINKNMSKKQEQCYNQKDVQVTSSGSSLPVKRLSVHLSSKTSPSQIVKNSKVDKEKAKVVTANASRNDTLSNPETKKNENNTNHPMAMTELAVGDKMERVHVCDQVSAAGPMESHVENAMFDITSDDEEDVLHTSMKELSFDQSHLMSLGVTIRLLRLHRVLHKLNQKDREDTMRKYRCFSRWQKNSRLSKRLRKSAEGKLMKAKIHYQKHLLHRCFYQWSIHSDIFSSLAEAHLRRCLLTKGIKALKLHMSNGKERDNLIKWRQNYLLTKSVFSTWRKKRRKSRQKRLCQAFNTWKIRHRHIRMLKIVLEQREKCTLIQCYCTWRKSFQQQELHAIASTFYSVRVKKKVFQAWSLYVADRDVHRNQNELAAQHHRYKISVKTFREWTGTTQKLLKAKRKCHDKIARRGFSQWHQSAQQLKLRRRKQAVVARQLRLTHLVRATWCVWTAELKATLFMKRRNRTDLRLLLVRWKVETEQSLLHWTMARELHRVTILRHSLRQWNCRCADVRAKRCEGIVILHRFAIRQFFKAWYDVIEAKKKSQEKVEHFRHFQDKLEEQRRFLQWKSLFYRILKVRKARSEWSNACVQHAAVQWLDFAKQRKIKRQRKQKKTEFLQSQLSRHFTKWKTQFGVEMKKAKKADDLFNLLSRRKFVRVFVQWHQDTQESSLVKPFVNTRERRQRTRFFDAWRGVVLRRHFLKERVERIEENKTRGLFRRWRWEYEKKQKVEGVLKAKEENATTNIFQAWKKRQVQNPDLDRKRFKKMSASRCVLKLASAWPNHKWPGILYRLTPAKTLSSCFVHLRIVWRSQAPKPEKLKKYFTNRQQYANEFSRRHVKYVIVSCYFHWKARVIKRHLAEEESLLLKIQNHRLLSKAFARWKQEVLCEKIVREDSASCFIKGHEFNFKFVTFKRWKTSFLHNKWASRFKERKMLALLARCLKGWHLHTEHTMQRQAEEFSASLKSRKVFSLPQTLSPSVNRSSPSLDLNAQSYSVTSYQNSDIPRTPPPLRRLVSVDRRTNSDSGLDLFKDAHSESSVTSSRRIHSSSLAADAASFSRDTSFSVIDDEDVRRYLPSTSFSPCDGFKTHTVDVIARDVISHALTDFRTRESGNFSAYCSETDEELTVRDLVASDLEFSEVESCTSESDKVVTQRRAIHPPGDSSDQIPIKTYPSPSSSPVAVVLAASPMCIDQYMFALPPRPRHGFQLVDQEARLEKLVHFAVSRLQSPSLSRAFYQWKLLTHAEQWDHMMLGEVKRKIEDRRLEQHLTIWRNQVRLRHLAADVNKRRLLLPCFVAWSEWILRKRTLHRMKAKSVSMSERRILAYWFREWLNVRERRASLNSILQYWKNRMLDHSQMDEQSHAVLAQHDLATLQSHFNVWKLKVNQLQRCDDHFNSALLQRAVSCWYYYTQEKADITERINSFRNRFLIKRTLHTWSRALRTRQKAEELRARCLKTWLVSLLARWHNWAEDNSERSHRYECLSDLKKKESLRQHFLLWRHRRLLWLIAVKSRDRAILYKSVIFWRRHIIIRKAEAKTLRSLTAKRGTLLTIKHFRFWQHAHQMKIIEEEIQMKKQSQLWKSWQHAVKTRRIQRLARQFTLRRFLFSWLIAHKEEKRNKEITRAVVTKWYNLTKKNRTLLSNADAFASDSINNFKAASFNKWSLAYRRLVDARSLHCAHTTRRLFSVWSQFSARRSRTKRLAIVFKSVSEDRSVLVSWQHWREESARLVQLRECCRESQRSRDEKTRLNCWSMWKRVLDVVKANQFNQRRLLNETYQYWHQAYENRQTAVTFDLLRINAVLRDHQFNKKFLFLCPLIPRLVSQHLKSWRAVILSKQSTIAVINAFETERSERALSGHYAIWRFNFFRLKLARAHNEKLIKGKCLTGWKDVIARQRIFQRHSQVLALSLESSLLKQCFRKWKESYLREQNDKFATDEFLCKYQFNTLAESWGTWKDQCAKRHALQLRVRCIERRYVEKWQKFMREKLLYKIASTFHSVAIKKRFLSRWKHFYQSRSVLRKRHRNVMMTCFEVWKTKVSCAIFAQRYMEHKLVSKAWAAWSLRHASVNAVMESCKEIERDSLMRTFQAWKKFVLERKTNENPSEPPSRIPRLKRLGSQ